MNTIISNARSMIAKVGEEGYVQVYRGPTTDHEGRESWAWRVLSGDGSYAVSQSRRLRGDYIWSGANAHASSPLNAMATLVSMLSAFAEARSSTSDNWDLFPTELRSWAQMRSDELSMLGYELDVMQQEVAHD